MLAFRPVTMAEIVAVGQFIGVILVAGAAAWVYLCPTVATFDASTAFARRASDRVRHIPDDQSKWRPSTGFVFADASGNAAKALFRALTGRRVNVSLRPDIAERATAFAEQIMVAVPAGDTANRDTDVRDSRLYAALLHDINGLIAIGRIGLVPALLQVNPLRMGLSPFLIEPASPEIARYLHPLGRRTVLDAVAQYVLPALALAVSLVAIAISVNQS